MKIAIPVDEQNLNQMCANPLGEHRTFSSIIQSQKKPIILITVLLPARAEQASELPR